jgi:hypothetical protein
VALEAANLLCPITSNQRQRVRDASHRFADLGKALPSDQAVESLPFAAKDMRDETWGMMERAGQRHSDFRSLY